MKKSFLSLSLLAASAIATTTQAADSTTDSNAAEIQALKTQVEALASALENKSSTTASKTTLGGYGEHHLNNLSGNASDQVDAHRFVLFVGHQYSDSLKFFSELEVEHGIAGEGQPGEVELEQAYIEKTFQNDGRLAIGQFLIPVGLINETHEPDTFYGVERNAVEKNIIPATWWETGLMYSASQESFSYDLAVHSSLLAVKGKDHDDDASTADLTGFDSIRGGRQKSAKADANEPAFTARIKGAPIKGLELALSYQYQSDLSGGAELGIDATLLTANAVWQKDQFTLKALYAMWDIDDKVEALPAGVGTSEQEGYIAELGYKLRENLGLFTRYSEWDNKAADKAESAIEQIDIGANYWLDDHVVIKADYQMLTAKANDAELNGINLGVGWSF